MMEQKISCVTGINGQVGSYLAELLLEKGYKVYGLVRRSSTFNSQRIDHIFNNPNLELVYGDLADSNSITSFVSKCKPDLFFNVGAQSHVAVSFGIPEYSLDVTGLGVMRCLEAIRKYSPQTRFLQFSTSEQFGGTAYSNNEPLKEDSKMHPRSPYGIAKLAGYWSTINYRESYNLFAANMIMFNTESPRRGETFATRKLSRAATRISLGLQSEVYMGNMLAKRNFIHAKDSVKAAYTIITADKPDEYVVGNYGGSHSIEEFAELAFKEVGLDYKNYVKFDQRYIRASEVDDLRPDFEKITSKLEWIPEISFKDIVKEMVESDLKLAKQELLIKNGDV
jgi:GDPmannose 4,6-dehydratase